MANRPLRITNPRKKHSMQERFEPSCRRERYQAQFQARRKKKDEGWADLADGLRNPVDKAYPELEDKAKEQLALNHFLSQIENPKTVDEAVSAALEMESYLDLKTVCKVDASDAVDAVEDPKSIGVNAMISVPDMMKQVMDRLEKLEARIDRPTSRRSTAPAYSSYVLELRKARPYCPFVPYYSSASGKRETLDGLSRPVESQDNPALLVNDIVISTLPHETFFVYGHVHGADVRFLVDTGAAVSLLNSTVWHKLSAKASLRLEPWLGARLVGVDDSQLRVVGQARHPLVIGTATISTSVVVVDALITEGILGMDFLRQHRCTIDIPGDCLLLAHQGIKVPLQGSDCSSSCYPVGLVQTVKIPPRSELEIAGESSIPIPGCHKRLWLLEGSPQKSQVLVARSLLESSGSKIPIRLCNPTVTMYRTTKMGMHDGRGGGETSRSSLMVQQDRALHWPLWARTGFCKV